MKAQRGYVGLAMVMALLIGVMLALSGLLSGQHIPTPIEQQATALQQLNAAKTALIAHAAADSNTPGTLGRQMDGAGAEITDEQKSQDSDEPRRLGTAGLGLRPAHDTQTECLWLALSPSFRDGLSNSDKNASNPKQLPVNPGNHGSITVRDTPQSAPRQVVAVLIDPGPALPGQTRTGGTGNGCHGGAWADFLETWDAQSRSFTLSGLQGSTNDTVVTISRNELFFPVLRRVLQSFNAGEGEQAGLRWFLARNGKYLADLVDLSQPASADKPASRLNRKQGPACTDTSQGVPLPCFDRQFAASNLIELEVDTASPDLCHAIKTANGNSYGHPAAWLCYNDWYSYLEYKIDNKDDGDPANDEATLSLVLNRGTPQAFGCALLIRTLGSQAADQIRCDDAP